MSRDQVELVLKVQQLQDTEQIKVRNLFTRGCYGQTEFDVTKGYDKWMLNFYTMAIIHVKVTKFCTFNASKTSILIHAFFGHPINWTTFRC